MLCFGSRIFVEIIRKPKITPKTAIFGFDNLCASISIFRVYIKLSKSKSLSRVYIKEQQGYMDSKPVDQGVPRRESLRDLTFGSPEVSP